MEVVQTFKRVLKKKPVLAVTASSACAVALVLAIRSSRCRHTRDHDGKCCGYVDFDDEGNLTRNPLSYLFGRFGGRLIDELYLSFNYSRLHHFTYGLWGAEFELCRLIGPHVRDFPSPDLDITWEHEWRELEIPAKLRPLAKQQKLYYRDGWFECTLILRERQSGIPFGRLLPASSHLAHIRWVVPGSSITDVTDLPRRDCPMAVLMSANGQEGYSARQSMVSIPLAALHSMGSIILENPLFGKRKAQAVSTSGYFNSVSDLVAVGAAAVDECRSLVQWLHANGFKYLASSGMSMGAATSTAAAATCQAPCTNASFMPAHALCAIWMRGCMSTVCNFEALRTARNLESIERTKLLFESLLEIADMRAYPPPKYAHTAVFVAATDDAYILPISSFLLHRHWAGSELRWVPGGHVTGFILFVPRYVQALADALNRYRAARDQELTDVRSD